MAFFKSLLRLITGRRDTNKNASTNAGAQTDNRKRSAGVDLATYGNLTARMQIDECDRSADAEIESMGKNFFTALEKMDAGQQEEFVRIAKYNKQVWFRLAAIKRLDDQHQEVARELLEDIAKGGDYSARMEANKRLDAMRTVKPNR